MMHVWNVLFLITAGKLELNISFKAKPFFKPWALLHSISFSCLLLNDSSRPRYTISSAYFKLVFCMLISFLSVCHNFCIDTGHFVPDSPTNGVQYVDHLFQFSDCQESLENLGFVCLMSLMRILLLSHTSCSKIKSSTQVNKLSTNLITCIQGSPSFTPLFSLNECCFSGLSFA